MTKDQIMFELEEKMSERLEAVGVTLPMMTAATARCSTDDRFTVKDATWGGVIDVYSDAMTIQTMVQNSVSCETDGIDFISLAGLLRDAADAYEAVGKRLAV